MIQDDWGHTIGTDEKYVNELIAERDALRADRDRLYGALASATADLHTYGTHEGRCNHEQCVCGFTENFEAARAVLREGR